MALKDYDKLIKAWIDFWVLYHKSSYQAQMKFKRTIERKR